MCIIAAASDAREEVSFCFILNITWCSFRYYRLRTNSVWMNNNDILCFISVKLGQLHISQVTNNKAPHIMVVDNGFAETRVSLLVSVHLMSWFLCFSLPLNILPKENNMYSQLFILQYWIVPLFICSEADILHHDKQYEPFYSSFVALSAHYITTVCGQSTYLSFPLHVIHAVLTSSEQTPAGSQCNVCVV